MTDDFITKLRLVLSMVNNLFEKFAIDQNLELHECAELRQALEACIGALEYEEACIEEALQTAGGHPSDLNNSKKVSTKSKDVEDYINNLEI